MRYTSVLSFHRKVATAETVSATTMLSLPKRNMDHNKKKSINSCLLKSGHTGP